MIDDRTLVLSVVLEILVQHESIHEFTLFIFSDIFHEVIKRNLLIIEARFKLVYGVLSCFYTYHCVKYFLGYFISWNH